MNSAGSDISKMPSLSSTTPFPKHMNIVFYLKQIWHSSMEHLGPTSLARDPCLPLVISQIKHTFTREVIWKYTSVIFFPREQLVSVTESGNLWTRMTEPSQICYLGHPIILKTQEADLEWEALSACLCVFEQMRNSPIWQTLSPHFNPPPCILST